MFKRPKASSLFSLFYLKKKRDLTDFVILKFTE